jgi:hypothetical protein
MGPGLSAGRSLSLLSSAYCLAAFIGGPVTGAKTQTA